MGRSTGISTTQNLLSALNEVGVLRITLAATLRNKISSLQALSISPSNAYYGQWRDEIDQLSEAKAVLTTPIAMTTAQQRLEIQVQELQEKLNEWIKPASEDPPDRPVAIAGAGAGEGAGGDGGVPAGTGADSVMGVAPLDDGGWSDEPGNADQPENSD